MEQGILLVIYYLNFSMLEETLSNMPVNLQGHNHQVISNLAKI